MSLVGEAEPVHAGAGAGVGAGSAGGAIAAVGPDEVSDAAAAGDDFAAFFVARQHDALRLAFLLCGDRARAEDVVADAFARVYPHTTTAAA